MTARSPRSVLAVIAVGLIGVLLLVLVRPLGWPLPEPLSAILWLAIPLGGAWLVVGRDLAEPLGLLRAPPRGIAIAALGSLAMALGLAIGGEAPSFDAAALWRGALRPGVQEELVFRGFAFGLLIGPGRWPVVRALLVTGALFGAFHVPTAWFGGHLDQAWGAAAITGAGGCWFAWLFVRWGRSLWVPVTAHVTMNLWWVLFTAGPTAAGGGAGAAWGRAGAIALVTLATVRWTPAPSEAPQFQ